MRRRICTQVKCEHYNSDGAICVEEGCYGILCDGKSTVADMMATHTILRGIVGIDGWVDSAIALKSYADHRPKIPVADYPTSMDAVYLMLMGYALEDLAKCIILCRAYDANPLDIASFAKEMKNIKFLLCDGTPWSIKSHDLDKLYSAKDIGFSVGPIEINHLKSISRYILWEGRYPVPVDVKQVPSSESSFDDMDNTSRKIYEKAMSEVQKLHTSTT